MKPELILPAGDLNKAKFAFIYGADACYGGLAKYSLRKAEVNFTVTGLGRAIELAHSLGKKFYVTFNIFAKNQQLGLMKMDLTRIAKLKPDAFIIADPGIVYLAKRYTKTPIHLSTQANTTNWQAVKFWKDLGIKRIVLAREATLKEISEVRKRVPGIEIETFIHGAMCVSYSGRCLLSKVMTGREANQGNCAQPCRWKYKVYLEEELRPGQYFPVTQDKEGTYIFNSGDLRAIEYLPKIIKAGVLGLKVEGRNKSEYYLSTIARAYRKALDAIEEGRLRKELPKLLKETEKVAHREYTSGFYFNEAKKGRTYNKRGPIEFYSFLGVVENATNEYVNLIPRNQIKVGDMVEVMTPENVYKEKVLGITNSQAEKVRVVNPLPDQNAIQLKFKKSYPKNSILRKRVNDKKK